MKMASLDQHRGYAQDHYGEVHQYRTTEYVPHGQAGGYQVLREPHWNKGEHRRSARPKPLSLTVCARQLWEKKASPSHPRSASPRT